MHVQDPQFWGKEQGQGNYYYYTLVVLGVEGLLQ